MAMKQMTTSNSSDAPLLSDEDKMQALRQALWSLAGNAGADQATAGTNPTPVAASPTVPQQLLQQAAAKYQPQAGATQPVTQPQQAALPQQRLQAPGIRTLPKTLTDTDRDKMFGGRFKYGIKERY